VAGFAIGIGTGAVPNSVTNVTISNCTLTAPAILDITANFGTVVLNNINLIPSNSSSHPGIAFVRSARIYGPRTYIGSSLSINNCAISKNGGLSVAGLIIENNSTILNLEFNGFSSNSPAAELIDIQSGSLG